MNTIRTLLLITVLSFVSHLASAEVISGYLIDLRCGHARLNPKTKTVDGVNDPRCVRDQDPRLEHSFGLLTEGTQYTLYKLQPADQAPLLSFMRSFGDGSIRIMKVIVSGRVTSDMGRTKVLQPTWIHMDDDGDRGLELPNGPCSAGTNNHHNDRQFPELTRGR